MDHNTIEHYNAYLVTIISANMVEALTNYDELEIYQKLNTIDFKEAPFKFEIEIVGSYKDVIIPFGKIPLTCSTKEEAKEEEQKTMAIIEYLIETQSGITTLEKEQSEKDKRKKTLRLIK